MNSNIKKLSFILAVLLILPLTIALSSCTLFASNEINDSSDVVLHFSPSLFGDGYEVDGSNITGLSSLKSGKTVEVVIPATYNNKSVIGIGQGAFKDCAVLGGVTIPDTVEYIHAWAFQNCTALETVHIPKKVRQIGGMQFVGCSSLKRFTADAENESLSVIDGNLYSKDGKTLLSYAPGNERKEFVIPKGVSSIANNAINHCHKIEKIVIPTSLTEIYNQSVSYCYSLVGVTVADDNPVYCSIDGNLYSKDRKVLLNVYNRAEKNYKLTIPDGVTSVADYAAYGYKNLTEVIFPNTVTSIGEYAFCDTALESLEIGSNITVIGGYAFARCDNLKSVKFAVTVGWSGVPVSGKFVNTADILATELASFETAAEHITNTYASYAWQRAQGEAK